MLKDIKKEREYVPDFMYIDRLEEYIEKLEKENKRLKDGANGVAMNVDFKTWEEFQKFIQGLDGERCLKVNYDPDNERYEVWTGSQPYKFYEDELDEYDRENIALKKEVKRLEKIIAKLKGKAIGVIKDIHLRDIHGEVHATAMDVYDGGFERGDTFEKYGLLLKVVEVKDKVIVTELTKEG
ncbi:hypothetical protein [Bacillus sp. NEAU-Y102]